MSINPELLLLMQRNTVTSQSVKRDLGKLKVVSLLVLQETSGMKVGVVTVQNHASGLRTGTSIKTVIECFI